MCKIKFQSSELKQALSVLSKVPTDKGVSAFSNILVSAEADHVALTAASANLKATARLYSWGGSAERGQWLLPSALLASIASQDGETTITLSIDSQAGTFRAECGGESAGGSIESEADKVAQYLCPCGSADASAAFRWPLLQQAVKSSAWAVCKDDIKPAMQGVFVKALPDGTTDIVATDGRKLIKSNIIAQTRGGLESFIIYPDLAKAILSVSADEATFSHWSGIELISVAIGNYEFTTRSQAWVYPNYNAVLPAEFGTEVSANRQHLQQSISRLPAYAALRVKLSAQASELALSCSNIDLGTEAQSALPAFVEGEEQSVWVAPEILAEALGKLCGSSVRISIASPKQPVIFRGADERSLVLVMPMLGEPEQQDEPLPEPQDETEAPEIDEQQDEALPDEKAAMVKALQESGRLVIGGGGITAK